MKDQKFRASLIWDRASGAEVRTRKHQGLKLDMPIKFGGKGRHLCPDELFLSSIGGCLLTTFLYFKKKLKINIEELEIAVSGTLRAGTEGYRISSIRAIISARARRSDEINVRRCIELAKEYCHITRTLEKVIPIEIIGKLELVSKLEAR
jgi:uncharacterized OsmC-like protein